LITSVYPNSPAERLGLKPEDILLTLKAENEKEIDLVPRRHDSYYEHYPDFPWDYRYGYGYRESFGSRRRRNYFTKLLSEIGAGRTATLTFLRGGGTQTAEFVLEDAPPDQESTPKFKDERIGWTVKELTYEIRDAQKLPTDTTGVVVVDIESGSKAALAQLGYSNVVLRVNGVTIKDLDHFKSMVDGFLKGSAKTMTLKTIHLGQTRFVDVERPSPEALEEAERKRKEREKEPPAEGDEAGPKKR
jgi:S1-C subfamily serine protease